MNAEYLLKNVIKLDRLDNKELSSMMDIISNLDEFKNSKVSIINYLEKVGEPNIEYSDKGVSFTQSTNPDLISIKYDPKIKFADNIKLYSIYILQNDLIYRVSKDSIISLSEYREKIINDII